MRIERAREAEREERRSELLRLVSTIAYPSEYLQGRALAFFAFAVRPMALVVVGV